MHIMQKKERTGQALEIPSQQVWLQSQPIGELSLTWSYHTHDTPVLSQQVSFIFNILSPG